MRYYANNNDGRGPKEISKDKYYSLKRRKGAREKTWVNDGEIVGREIIINN